jgi:SET domain-containing protein
MAFLEDQLIVKRSTLPQAGKGLFTKKPIKKGTRIVEYTGKLTTWNDVELDADNAYIFFINKNRVIDAREDTGFARFANDARGLKKVTGITNNAAYINDKNRIYIDAIKDIPAGGEILVSYGKDYWDTMRQNLKD